MKLTFRWYSLNDEITLEKIRQIPCVEGVVSAIYDVPVGEIWSEESIKNLVDVCNQNGLSCEVIESVPVHEDIKLGNENAKKYIENYKENIKRLAKYGVKCVCYNFMPVFDWLRSDMESLHKDGSNALLYKHENVLNMNPLTSELSLPGWDSSYTKEGMRELLEKYKGIDEEKLWQNFTYFLKEVIPVAEECGINMAIHPDDPPWGIFGLPRIMKNVDDVKRLLKTVDSKANGLTLCTGSFGVGSFNDLVEIANIAKERVHFVHLRNIKRLAERDFIETAHPSCYGDVDMYLVLKTLVENGFDGYVRPDHGRRIWGEKGRYGYGLFDRALGATYLAGLFEAIKKNNN